MNYSEGWKPDMTDDADFDRRVTEFRELCKGIVIRALDSALETAEDDIWNYSNLHAEPDIQLVAEEDDDWVEGVIDEVIREYAKTDES